MKTQTLPQAPFINASAAGSRSAAVSAATRAPASPPVPAIQIEDDDGTVNAELLGSLGQWLHRAIIISFVTFCLCIIFLIGWQIHRTFPGN